MSWDVCDPGLTSGACFWLEVAEWTLNTRTGTPLPFSCRDLPLAKREAHETKTSPGRLFKVLPHVKLSQAARGGGL